MQERFIAIPRLEVADPWWLLLLPLFAALAWLLHIRRSKTPALLFAGVERLKQSGFDARKLLRKLPWWLRWSAFLLLGLALAGPRLLFRQSEAETKGIDVILALDISESMLQRDAGGTSRLDAAREVARNFVLRRSSDRIGLVVFRGKGYTQCPLTRDHEVLAMLLERMTPGVIQDDGTAIGSAILIALNRLKGSSSSHKVVILVTDGENNAGEVGPATAAELAQSVGVRIYVVNAGFKTVDEHPASSGEAATPGLNAEETLQGVARTTHGGYFRVEDRASFDQTIRTIDRMEKTRFAGPLMERRSDLFLPLLLLGVVLLFVEVVLSNTRLLRIP